MNILILRLDNSFETSVYHQPSFCGIYSSFNSFASDQHKTGLVWALLFQTFAIVSNLSRFRKKASYLNEVLKRNKFLIKWIVNCVIATLNKKVLHAPVRLSVEKKELFLVLPYLGNLSLALRTRLHNNIKKNFHFAWSKLFLNSQHIFRVFSDLKIKYLLTYA